MHLRDVEIHSALTVDCYLRGNFNVVKTKDAIVLVIRKSFRFTQEHASESI